MPTKTTSKETGTEDNDLEFLRSESSEEDSSGVEQTFKLGDKEYSQTELEDIVSRGTKAKEIESQWNTPIDKIYPDYTKKSQLLKDPNQLANYYQTQFGKPLAEVTPQQAPSSTPTPDENEEARKLIMGWVKTDPELQTMIDQRADTRLAATRLLDECDLLAAEYDGTDGRPAFNKDAVLNFMTENGIGDPEVAYEVMHRDTIRSLAGQPQEVASKPPFSEKGGAGAVKMPKEKKYTFDDPEGMRAGMEEYLASKGIGE